LGHTVEKLFTHLGVCPRETAFIERPLQKQRNWLVPFPSPAPQQKHRSMQESAQHQHLLPNLLTPTLDPYPWGTASPTHTCLSPSMVGPFPQKTNPNSWSHYVSPCRSFSEPLFPGGGDRLHFANRREHI